MADTIGGVPAPHPPPPAPLPSPPPPVPEFPGFWSVGPDGRIQAFGDARSAGDLAGRPLGGPIVSLTATPAGQGYWMVGADGGVFAFGDSPARSLPVPAGQLRLPAVHLEPTPTGKGYWVLSAAGEVIPFGDAPFRGAGVSPPGGHRRPGGDADRAGLLGRHRRRPGLRLRRRGPAGGDRRLPLRPSAPPPARPSRVLPRWPSPVHPTARGTAARPATAASSRSGCHSTAAWATASPTNGRSSLEATSSGAGYYVAGGDGAVFAFGDADRRRERGPGGGEAVIDVAFRPTGGPAGGVGRSGSAGRSRSAPGT